MVRKNDSFITDITDEDELEEIRKISKMLNADEKVLLVARQSRIKPGGSYFTPNTIYATDRRVILRDPSMLGLKEEIVDIPYNVILNARLDRGVFSSSVVFDAPLLFNPTMSNNFPGLKKLNPDEHGENGVIDAIPKSKADTLIQIIRNGINQVRANPGFNVGFKNYNTTGNSSGSSNVVPGTGKLSVLEELQKLADLKDKGAISEAEFVKMKEKILKDD
ncbi:MAG: PH domain-containing protein [Candidatus Nitrosocosmicus sp.]